MSNHMSAAPVSHSPVSPRNAPEGLGWVIAGLGRILGEGLSPSPATTQASELRRAASDRHGLGHVAVQRLELLANLPFGSIGSAQLRRLFTRTSGGVTVRAFAAVWAAAPLELIPTASGSTSTPTVTAVTPATTGIEPGSSVAASHANDACELSVTQALVVEVSDAGAVGVITVPLGPPFARPSMSCRTR